MRRGENKRGSMVGGGGGDSWITLLCGSGPRRLKMEGGSDDGFCEAIGGGGGT